MKTCNHCGGFLYRHAVLHNGIRYRCKECGKCITVRDGEVSTLRGRPVKVDWRVGA